MLKYLLTSLLITTTTSSSLYDFKIKDISGVDVDFKQFKGKTLLLVNTASQCGQTDAHYKSLKRLHEILSFGGKFEILAFPCNDFGEQEPWDDKEIEEFVRGHFKAEFKLFPKMKILGSDKHPFWAFVEATSSSPPSWNFGKYLYNQKGEFIKSWDANVSVEDIFEAVRGVIGEEEGEDVKEEL